MNPTATKVLAGLVLFASGVVMGFFGSRYLAERGRLALLHGDPKQFSEMVLRHMSEDLDLTKAQQEKLRPIVMNTGEALAKIRQEQEPKVHAVIEKSVEAIKALLTPEQREKFTALMARLEKRRKAMERFGPPPPPPPGMGGFPPPPHPPGMDGFPPPPPPGMEDYPPPGMEGHPPHHHPWPDETAPSGKQPSAPQSGQPPAPETVPAPAAPGGQG